MKAELQKRDLIFLIRNTVPPRHMVDGDHLINKCGTYISYQSYLGVFTLRWEWYDLALQNLTEEELWQIYTICRDAYYV